MNRSEERAAYWRRMITHQQSSGVSISAFCRKQNLSQPSFYAWRRKLEINGRTSGEPAKERASSTSALNPTFVAVPGISAKSNFEIRLLNGTSIVVPSQFDESALQRVLGVVQGLRENDA